MDNKEGRKNSQIIKKSLIKLIKWKECVCMEVMIGLMNLYINDHLFCF